MKAKPYNRLAIYLVAHQDDWQLFMDPVVSEDIVDQHCKTVMIHTTAGDAGLTRQYWHAREQAALNSVLFRVACQPEQQLQEGRLQVGPNAITSYNLPGNSSYFLRLPDGGMTGQGFKRYSNQSLEKFRQGSIATLTSVDGQCSYYHMGMLINTIQQIIEYEARLVGLPIGPEVSLHFPEHDTALSPDDHSDHFNTSLLLQATNAYHKVKKYAYVHYHIQHAAPDLAGLPLFWKTGMFCIYHQTVLNMHGHSTIDESFQYPIWCTKDCVTREVFS